MLDEFALLEIERRFRALEDGREDADLHLAARVEALHSRGNLGRADDYATLKVSVRKPLRRRVSQLLTASLDWPIFPHFSAVARWSSSKLTVRRRRASRCNLRLASSSLSCRRYISNRCRAVASVRRMPGRSEVSANELERTRSGKRWRSSAFWRATWNSRWRSRCVTCT